MTTRFYAIFFSFAPLFLLVPTAPAQAFRLFSGYDENPTARAVLTPIYRVNSLTASQAFDQAVNNGTVTTESFEDQSTRQAIDGLSLNISGVQATFSYLKKSDGTSATTSGASTKVQKADANGLTNAGTFPTNGEKGISINSSNHFGLNFSQSLAAFSFWGTDLGDSSNRLTVEFYQDNNLVKSQLIDYLGANAGSSSVFFFGGLAETTAEQFNRIQLISSIGSTGDAIGLDQLTIATPEQVLGAASSAAASNSIVTSSAATSSAATTAVPTPALLPGLLGFALSVMRKRRDLA